MRLREDGVIGGADEFLRSIAEQGRKIRADHEETALGIQFVEHVIERFDQLAVTHLLPGDGQS